MSTLSREILDIYHMTRKKKNSDLYSILPQSYRQILYQLHSNYISQKLKTNSDDDTSDNLDISDGFDIDDCDCKISITVDDVYTKLKKIDIRKLVEIYKDRDVLINNIRLNATIITPCVDPIKSCTSTTIQSKLLSMNCQYI
jgi:hypothetical protein